MSAAGPHAPLWPHADTYRGPAGPHAPLWPNAERSRHERRHR